MPYRYQGPLRNRTDLGLETERFILILQGNGINVRRGAEEAVMSMKYLDDSFLLLIIGNGDVIPALQKIITDEKLQSRVQLIPGMPYNELMDYTSAADLGLSLDRGDNLNYLYSLPNKIFDYIQAGTPVLCSDLPELRRVVEQYKTGMILSSLNPEEMAESFKCIRKDTKTYEEWRVNCKKAANILCREKEEQEILTLIDSFRK
jgi:glycosyltransferase involved in cell wall biosynthesis